MNGEPLLRVRLSAEYSGSIVLRDLAFELQPGEVLGLVGSSGAGKSTLVLSLVGLLPWRGGRVSGEVFMAGRNLLALSEKDLRRIRGRSVALVPQSPMTALNAALSLQSHFREAWRAHEERGRGSMLQRVRELMTEVQLPADDAFLRRRPSQISVGQAQRVLIALALLHRPALIIADEPTSALDPVTQVQIVDLLRNLNRRHGTSLLYISHDLISVMRLCDRIAVLDHGTIVESLPAGEIGRARHPASRALVQALPVPPDAVLRFRDHPVGPTEADCALPAEFPKQ